MLRLPEVLRLLSRVAHLLVAGHVPEPGAPLIQAFARALALGASLAGLAIGLNACGSSRPEPRTPLDVDWDMADSPEPAEDPPNQYYDFFEQTFTNEIHQAFDMPRNFRKLAGSPKQAENVDAFGEVPSSSWFTNRNARRHLTIEEIKAGPNRGAGPAEGTWTITRGKTEGVTPGFMIKDEKGDRYFIKFDPVSNPEMSSAAEMISTKLFWAAGYNVPENYLVHWTKDRLRIDPEAKISDKLGKKRPMTEADLEEMLGRVARRTDGSYRTIASKLIAGTPKGPFSYLGTRQDDPNDTIDHEHRRELRGLRLLAAWLEHNDVRRINSLDLYVREDARGFVKHYLLDFGATLGSASLFPNKAWEGHEYIFDAREAFKSLVTLGLYKRRWHDAPEVEHPTVGLYESKLFHPANWKPNYPNPAFENMTALDAYWAAKIVMSFTDEQIEAVVGEAQLSDTKAAEYLVRTIVERRDQIGRTWYRGVNAIDRFRLHQKLRSTDSDHSATVESQLPGTVSLLFDDLEVEAGFASASDVQVRCRLFRNGRGGMMPLTEERTLYGTTEIPIDPGAFDAIRAAAEAPEATEEDRYACMSIWSKRDPSARSWGKWVRAHLYWDSGTLRLVGVEHES